MTFRPGSSGLKSRNPLKGRTTRPSGSLESLMARRLSTGASRFRFNPEILSVLETTRSARSVWTINDLATIQPGRY
jgi:hypothetical protein